MNHSEAHSTTDDGARGSAADPTRGDATAAPGGGADPGDTDGRARLRAEFDRQLREGVRPDGPDSTVERVGGVVRHTSTPAGWNGVIWSDLTEATADAAIAEQVRHFGARGVAFEWKLYDYDEPADLGRRLLAAGFTAEPAEALMVAEVARQAAEPRPPEGVSLRPVRDAADVALMAEVHARAFGTDATRLHQRVLEQLEDGSETMHAVLAMAGDEPVCAARMEFNPGTDFVGLWGGGTVAAWRGRGIYRALVAHRARLAAEHGYRYLQVDASDDSRPILERLGFVRLATTTPYVRES
ncbi:GNAT family N-acetyltransferase [Streptomyces sp. NPDC057702]|uniref:GNAT family N-acetyltransferase n=1 Tax=unclassified Streptomyces TaxID=2593676 RepID=UPI00367C504E